MTPMNMHELAIDDTKKYGIDNLIYDKSLDQLVFEFKFQPAFKECANLSRTIYFSSYLSWIGKVRELFMSSIGDQLVPQISSGEWGLVTNWCDLKIFGEARTYDNVLAKFRLGKVAGAVIPLECEFLKLNDDETYERLAFVEQETTWVEIIGHGKVKPAEFPGYFSKFLEGTARKSTENEKLSKMNGSFSRLDKGNEIYKAPLTPNANQSIFSQTFSTTLEDSNLVGNVYYGNYFIWQGRVRDIFINSIAKEYMRGIGLNGEMICVHSRLNYLRDAMPFDQVEVTLSPRTVNECGVVFEFQYFRNLEDNSKEKLAVGLHEFVWSKYDNHGNRVSIPIPDTIKRQLLP